MIELCLVCSSAVILGLVIACMHYRPKIDTTSEGDVIVWYNYHYYNDPNKEWFVSRQYKHLFKIKK
jgi:hypothetical protein